MRGRLCVPYPCSSPKLQLFFNFFFIFTIHKWVVYVFAVQGWGCGVGGVRGACNLNIGDDLSGVLSSAPAIDALCTHGLRLEAADENRIAEGISPPNDMEKHCLPDL